MTKEQSLKLMKDTMTAEQGKKARTFENGIKANAVDDATMLQMLLTIIQAAQEAGDEATDFEMSFYASLVITDLDEETIMAVA